MSDDDLPFELDGKVLEGVAWLICGDDTTSAYRRGYEIEEFFSSAGWTDVGELDGPRQRWTLDRLTEKKGDPAALRRVVLRLADPREYLDDDEAWSDTVHELNRLLAVEGYEVSYSGPRPQITEVGAGPGRIGTDTPAELTASLTDLVSDEVFGIQLRARLDEAYLCWQSGAPTAAIIMLGSLLEGVLYDVACSRYVTGPKPVDHLQNLITLAREKKWIAREVSEYADVLRHHRNLVHPKRQWSFSYQPSDNSARVAWNVVVAALNDLADTPDDQISQ